MPTDRDYRDAVGNRAGWGVRGSWFVIANRLILSICW